MARARAHEPLRPVTRPLGRSSRARARANGPRRAADLPGNDPKRRGDPPAWALRMMRSRGSRRLATLLAALIGLGLIIGVSGARVARQPIGYVGVVRNGGPPDTPTLPPGLLARAPLARVRIVSEYPPR